MLLSICLSLLSFSSLKAQFRMPLISASNYPSPALITDYLSDTTAYLSNFSTDHIHSWYSTKNKGLDIVAWTYSAAAGGGGSIALGTHDLTSSSLPFVGDQLINVPNAVDLRVGALGDFIVAAYYNAASNLYQVSWWLWAGPGTTASYMGTQTIPISPAPTAYERISMDINLDGDKAAIILSNAGTIWSYGVSLIGGTLSFPSSARNLSSLIGAPTNNINPDLAFNREFGISTTDYVYYTYYNSSSGLETVYKTDYNTFTVAGFIFSSLDSYSLPSGVNAVNFDCPDMYALDHWAYTYAYNSSGNNIALRCDAGSGAYSALINDGSCSPLPNIIHSGSVATIPDIAYNLNSNDEVVVVWASTEPSYYTLSPAYTATYIAATATLGASSISSSYGAEYAIIPDSFDVYPTSTPLIAINRNIDVANRLVSYTTNHYAYALKHKNIAHTNPFYKKTDPAQNQGLIRSSDVELNVYPNPFTHTLKLSLPYAWQNQFCFAQLYDMQGKIIKKYQGYQIEKFVNDCSQELPLGHFFLHLSNTNQASKTFKITKQ